MGDSAAVQTLYNSFNLLKFKALPSIFVIGKHCVGLIAVSSSESVCERVSE